MGVGGRRAKRVYLQELQTIGRGDTGEGGGPKESIYKSYRQ